MYVSSKLVRANNTENRKEHIYVVNETFISDCIIWSTLLDPNAKHYKAKGAACITKDLDKLQPEKAVPSSRKRKLSPPRTQNQTPERSIEELAQPVTTHERAPEVLNSKDIEYTDALADTINQAKGLEHVAGSLLPFTTYDADQSPAS